MFDPHAIPVDLGMTIEPPPVRDSLVEVDVVAMITNVSHEFNNVVDTLKFVFTFLFTSFVFKLSSHFFNAVN